MSQWTPVTSDIPQRSRLGPLFNIFVRAMDSGIENTLSKSANEIRLRGVVEMLEERDDIQRDLDGLERRSHANSNKAILLTHKNRRLMTNHKLIC